jgi:hypothetical protein
MRPVRTRSSRRLRALILAALLALVVLAQRFWVDRRAPGTPAETPAAPAARERAGGSEVEAAFAARAAGVWVEAEGQVERLLADDSAGSRHQRFILRLASGHTLLVAHNIDLAPRLPLAAGDALSARGEYEWNPEGGVLHWTHRDPEGRRAGGWIEHGGRRYQ